MIIEAQVTQLDEIPDMSTQALSQSDPRLRMEVLRGMPIFFKDEKKPVGMVIIPRIEDDCICVTANVNDDLEIDGLYLVASYDFIKCDMGVRGLSLSLSKNHTQHGLSPIYEKHKV